ncbi:MAG: hypothetical protein HZB51_14615 [Chloroflexi bacterium]|nr:hypothetical protein [Chloroflexota bacterium]
MIKTFTKIIFFLLIVLWASACTAEPTLVPTATMTAQPSPTLTATLTPSPTATATQSPTLTPSPIPTATKIPTPVPLRPTATPYAGTVAERGTYVNDDLGVTVRYPHDWSSKAGTSQTTLVQFYAPQNRVISALISSTIETNDSLEALAPQHNRHK